MLAHSRETMSRLLGDDGRWSNPAAAMDPTQSIGASDDVATLRLIADDLGALLLSESPRLIAATSYDDWWRAACARTHRRRAAALSAMADTSATRFARLMGLRDAMMADNLLDIAAREARRGPTLVFAHTATRAPELLAVGRFPAHVVECWLHRRGTPRRRLHPAGHGIRRRPDRGLDAPAPDALEGVLVGLPASRYIFGAARLAQAVGDEKPRTDHSPEQGYFPLVPEHLDGVDGVLFLRSV